MTAVAGSPVARPPRPSGDDLLARVVALLGLIPVALALSAFLILLLGRRSRVGDVAGTLLSMAGVFGVPVLVFGTWLCLRRIGSPRFRVLALLLGIIAVGAWPLANWYLARVA